METTAHWRLTLEVNVNKNASQPEFPRCMNPDETSSLSLGAILDVFAFDIENHPERLIALRQPLLDRIAEFVGDMDVDLGAPLDH